MFSEVETADFGEIAATDKELYVQDAGPGDDNSATELLEAKDEGADLAEHQANQDKAEKLL